VFFLFRLFGRFPSFELFLSLLGLHLFAFPGTPPAALCSLNLARHFFCATRFFSLRNAFEYQQRKVSLFDDLYDPERSWLSAIHVLSQWQRQRLARLRLINELNGRCRYVVCTGYPDVSKPADSAWYNCTTQYIHWVPHPSIPLNLYFDLFTISVYQRVVLSQSPRTLATCLSSSKFQPPWRTSSSTVPKPSAYSMLAPSPSASPSNYLLHVWTLDDELLGMLFTIGVSIV